jgi:hypothetical protein
MSAQADISGAWLVLLLLQGLIHVSELLAPSHLVDGEEAEDEAEAYTEVDNIDPAAYYKVRHACCPFTAKNHS